MNCYLLGLPTVKPRNLILPVFLSAVFIWFGLLAHGWRRPKAYSLFVLLLAVTGGFMTVAQSGWQGTNFDRYLVWTLPVLILFFAEGLHAFCIRYLSRSFFVPLVACFLFFVGTAFVSICQYNQVSSELGARPLHHLYGFYSPVFSVKAKSAAFEILKNDPSARFDYWILSPEHADAIPNEFRTACYGESVLAGPDGYEVRRADWSTFDRANVPHAKIPSGKHLVCRVDVGHEKDEKTALYEVLDRYGRTPIEPFILIDNIKGKPAIDVARLVIGGDAMTLPLHPQRDAIVVMRTYPQHTLAYNLIGERISSSYAFANPLKINVTVNDKAITPISVTYATNGFSDVTFTLPGSAIAQSPCRLAFLGDHITAGYWFYQ